MWELVFVVILVGVPFGILLQAYVQAKKKVAHIPGWTQLFPPIVYRNLPFLQAPISDTYQLFWKYAHEGYQNFGSIFKIVISGIYAVMISDPDFAKFVAVNHDKYFLKKLQRSEAIREEVGINIFNAHENDIWRRHRLLLNPAFSDESMAVVADATVSQTKQLMNDINKEPTRNVIPDMSNLTLNVIGYAGFGYEFNAFSLESQTNPDSVMNAQARFFYNGSRFSFFPKFMRHWTVIPFLKQYHRDKDTIKAAIGDIIDHRLKQQNLLESQRDILALLINAAKGVNEKDDDDLKPLTKQEMIADCITFIIAGHETVYQYRNID
jgi:cytochrome P450